MSSLAGGLLSPRAMLGAAIVGLIGAAGMVLIEQIYNDRRRVVLAQDLARLDKQVASMKEELDSLKELQARYIAKKNAAAKKHPPKHTRKPSGANGVEPKINASQVKPISAQYTSDTDFADYNSALGTDYDVSSEEFYDVSSDSEDEIKDNNLVQNGSVELRQELKDLVIVDDLLANGSVDELYTALKMLNDMKESMKSAKSAVDKHVLSDVLWRLGKCLHRQSNLFESNNDKKGKKQVVFDGIDYCREAIELDPNNGEAHKWYAIMVGLRSEYVSTKEKIEDGSLFKDHVQIALELNPNDASLYHLMGRFKLEIATLSWLEKKVASTLFAEVPSFTHQDSLDDFIKAEEFVERDWKENRLFIAKCYIGMGDYSSAVEWLDKTVSITSITSDDELIHIQAEKLLKDYGSYRST